MNYLLTSRTQTHTDVYLLRTALACGAHTHTNTRWSDRPLCADCHLTQKPGRRDRTDARPDLSAIQRSAEEKRAQTTEEISSNGSDAGRKPIKTDARPLRTRSPTLAVSLVNICRLSGATRFYFFLFFFSSYRERLTREKQDNHQHFDLSTSLGGFTGFCAHWFWGSVASCRRNSGSAKLARTTGTLALKPNIKAGKWADLSRSLSLFFLSVSAVRDTLAATRLMSNYESEIQPIRRTSLSMVAYHLSVVHLKPVKGWPLTRLKSTQGGQPLAIKDDGITVFSPPPLVFRKKKP